ncbi:helix-turn-helix domain-containing protein [Paenibacillus thiaminolyticus]|uniref:helix-turn-helix domain-containing protein n=1 Tax=Paenibacillus thiaminolyticus TaxID=49283 RepID=UPI003D2913E0
MLYVIVISRKEASMTPIEELQRAIQTYVDSAVSNAISKALENLHINPDRKLDVGEAAAYISSPSKPISTKTLYAMCKREEIPHRRMGTRIFFSTAALDRWGREQDQKNYAGWRESS